MYIHIKTQTQTQYLVICPVQLENQTSNLINETGITLQTCGSESTSSSPKAFYIHYLLTLPFILTDVNFASFRLQIIWVPPIGTEAIPDEHLISLNV